MESLVRAAVLQGQRHCLNRQPDTSTPFFAAFYFTWIVEAGDTTK